MFLIAVMRLGNTVLICAVKVVSPVRYPNFRTVSIEVFNIQDHLSSCKHE